MIKQPPDMWEEVGSQLLADKFKNDMNTPWYMSSANPLELSLTIKGLLLGYLPIILTVAQNLNVPLSNTGAVNLVSDVSFTVAVLVVVGGLLRKLYYRFK